MQQILHKTATTEVCSQTYFNFLIKLYYLLCSCAKKQCVQALSDNVFWAFECLLCGYEILSFLFSHCILKGI